MNVPDNLRYTKEHEWLRLDGNIATVGITDYAQGELGDIVFVELPELNTEVKQMAPFGTIEAVKAVSELFSPVSGKVIEVNAALDDDPMVINRDPYGDGWMVRIEVADAAQVNELLDAAAYRKLIE
ncbi:MAG: glycine cleavage system protein GcvH [Candidatus Zixiibacteriota bacterium]|nr:MAG: glycine cleavage system protein GcvH [candidate division Zixibacteria bacterium]